MGNHCAIKGPTDKPDDQAALNLALSEAVKAVKDHDLAVKKKLEETTFLFQ